MKNLLSDVQCRKAKCLDGKPFTRFADGEGLYLVAFPAGGKSFQFRYKYDGKETIATLKGVEGLAEARAEADRLRKMIAAGDDPRVVKQVERVERIAANGQTFEVLRDAWIEQEARRQQWTPDYIESVKATFENHLKALYPMPVTRIVARITAPMLREVEKNAPGVVDRLAARLHAVMEFAREEGHFEVNPLPRRRAAKAKDKNKAKHFPAVTDLPGVGGVLRAFDELHAQSSERHFRKNARGSIRRAHLLLVFTAMRISEVVNAQWKEFDLEAGTWAIPRERMKIKNPERGPHHIVPLPPRLLAQLREWRAADAKSAVFVCPSARNPKSPILDVQVGAVYRDNLKLTGKHSAHSWRSVFKTVCKEARKEFDLIESQLDHIAGNAVAAAYDRSRLLDPRRELMAWYEETIIAARDGAKVLPLKKTV